MDDVSADGTADFDLSAPRQVHLVGIGGAGMRAIAQILAETGHTVTGSDRAHSAALDRLNLLGITTAVGHDAANLGDPALIDAIAHSTAVGVDNPEITAARAAGVPVLRRADLLAAMTAARPCIAVAGTHGKTTTSALLAEAFLRAGHNPSYLVGAELAFTGTGGHADADDTGPFVSEADESDGSFAALRRSAAIVTNLEPDHLDFHGDFAGLVAAFDDFIAKTEGPVVACADDAGSAALAATANAGAGATTRRVSTYGMAAEADYRIEQLVEQPLDDGRPSTAFVFSSPDGSSVDVVVGLPGAHNARNAAAALAIAGELGFALEPLAGAMANFSGVARRFEPRGTVAGVTFIDDYAHLPSEVAAAIAGAKAGAWTRVVAAFQPHRYTRTKAIGADFGPSFDQADALVLTDIYAAGEEPLPDVSGRLIYDAVAAASPALPLTWAPGLAAAVTDLAGLLRPGDLCLTLGAGDLTTIPEQVQARLLHNAAERAAEIIGAGAELGGSLAQFTTYRVGGPAAVLVADATSEQLALVAVAAAETGLEVLTLGRGSNLLIADAGFAGIAVSLGDEFATVEIDGTMVTAGCSATLPVVARKTVAAGLTGFEWAVGVPGSVGGAVRMNAGGHGSDMAASLRTIRALDFATGDHLTMTAASLGLGYRSSALTDRIIVTDATLELEAAPDPEASARMLSEIVQWRRQHQPGGANAGSVFTNPAGSSAGALIDAAGGKGLRVGTAEVSTKHANFIQADPGGSADDVAAVMAGVRTLVASVHNVDLVAENRLVGFDEATSFAATGVVR